MEDFEKNKLKIHFAIVASILIIIIIIFLVNNILKSNDNKYLLIGENLILEKDGKKWNQLLQFNENITKNKFTLADGDNVYKDGNIDYTSEKYYYLDKNFNELKNIRIAYSNLDDIPLANYEKSRCDISDTKYFKKVLKKKKIIDFNKFITGCTKIQYDIDKDGENETIYTSTNRGFEAIKDDVVATLFVTKNNKILDSYTKTSKDSYRIIEILDLDNNGDYDFIINRKDIDLSTFNSCYQIYEIKGGKWELKQDCQNQ